MIDQFRAVHRPLSESEKATMAAAHNVYALHMAQATRAGLEAAHPDQRAFVLTRSGYAGIQRYAAAWTGDAPSTLAALQGTLPMLLGLGLSGEPWVGSDVGGYSGQKDPALFARWWTLGAISPFFRGHAEKSAPNQEPWQWGTEVRDLARDLLGQRYRLLPYLESLADAAHATGAPVLRPLFWEFPSEIATELIDDEALLGPFLLYAPHTQPDVKTRAVVFPPGMWLQAWSGAIVQGPTTQQVSGPLADLPLWLRAQAHRRRCGREAGLYAGHDQRRAPHSRQMGVRSLRNPDSGPGTGAGDRQRTADGRDAGACRRIEVW